MSNQSGGHFCKLDSPMVDPTSKSFFEHIWDKNGCHKLIRSVILLRIAYLGCPKAGLRPQNDRFHDFLGHAIMAKALKSYMIAIIA